MDGNLDAVREMIVHPATIVGLADAGAHVKLICDGSSPSTQLTHWTRDRTRGETIPLEFMVEQQTRRTARLYGFDDRGTIEVGRAGRPQRDRPRATSPCAGPVMHADLPAGGQRYLQPVSGYVATVVGGVQTRATIATPVRRPGRLVEEISMKYRTLGRTGVEVSELCLGAMMFGVWGQSRPRRLGAHHPPCARRRHQLHRHRRRVLGGGVGEDRRRRRSPTASAAATWCSRRRRTGRWDGPQRARQLAAVDHGRGREQPAPARHRLHRPLPDPPARPDVRRRGDAVRADRPRARRQDPLLRLVDVPRATRSSRRSGSPTGVASVVSCASNRRTRSSPRGIERDVLPVAQKYGMGVIPWSPLNGGFLSGRYRTGVTPEPSHRDRIRAACDGGESPAEHAKRDGGRTTR